MTDKDFPALFQDSDRTAAETQSRFLSATKAVLISSLVVGFVPNLLSRQTTIIVQVAACAIVIAASAYLAFGRPQKVWYATRALAESVKTITWRYVCRAEPFDSPDGDDAEKFENSVRQLLRANDEAAALRYKSVGTDLITQRMKEIRSSSLMERREIYLKNRIEDQLGWYLTKSAFNDCRSKVWYAILLASGGLALIVSLYNLSRPADLVSVDFLFAIPIAVFGWIQVKRFQELASSYALTAHEITFVKANFVRATTEGAFSHFVADAENAFSREHTQWFARKDI